MNKEVFVPKYYPKGEVLRKTAERYPEIDADVMEIIRQIKRLSSGNECVFQAALEPFSFRKAGFMCCAACSQKKSPDIKRRVRPKSPSSSASPAPRSPGCWTDWSGMAIWSGSTTALTGVRLTIHMAAKGREVLEAFIPQQCRRSNAQMACLSPEEKQTLIALLSKIQS